MGDAVNTRPLGGSQLAHTGLEDVRFDRIDIGGARAKQKDWRNRLVANLNPPISSVRISERKVKELTREEAKEAAKKEYESKIINIQAEKQKLEAEKAEITAGIIEIKQELAELESGGSGSPEEIEDLKAEIESETSRLSRTEVKLAGFDGDIGRLQTELNAKLQSFEPPAQPNPAALPNPPSQPPPAVPAPTPQPAAQTPSEVRTGTPPPPLTPPSTTSTPPNLDNLRAQIVDSSGPNVNVERMDGQLGQIQGTFDQLTQIQKQIPAEGRPTPDQLAEVTHLKATLVDEFKALATLEGVSPEMQKTLESISQAIADMPDIVYLGGDDNASKHLPQTQEDPQKAAAHALQTAQVQIQKEPTQSPKEAAKNAAVQSVEGGPRSSASAAAAATAQLTQPQNTEEAQNENPELSEQHLETREDVENDYAQKSESLDNQEKDEIKELEKQEKGELGKPENKNEASKEKIKKKYDELKDAVKAKYAEKKEALEKEYIKNLLKLNKKHPSLSLEEKRALQERLAQLEEDRNGRRRENKYLGVEVGQEKGEQVTGTQQGINRSDAGSDEQETDASPSLIKAIADLITGIFKRR